ncbi:YnbE family lipoprotein [Croceicoccus ponticola]|uniref:YnbE family lipoprotein n=2 Tax=Croceicoccus ponticola TaxID=2217664 RepID=A0A437H2G3_9SPHN|nr:YnbE family lipoprotein [Croceicoccus ponticola]RVQ69746.1 YnbE family lipoprotein [Croceicoccus ponticola]
MGASERQSHFARGLIIAGALACSVTLSACVNVNAPSEPIVIELNVNIKQEVLYRLVDSAEENIAENPEIF